MKIFLMAFLALGLWQTSNASGSHFANCKNDCSTSHEATTSFLSVAPSFAQDVNAQKTWNIIWMQEQIDSKYGFLQNMQTILYYLAKERHVSALKTLEAKYNFEMLMATTLRQASMQTLNILEEKLNATTTYQQLMESALQTVKK